MQMYWFWTNDLAEVFLLGQIYEKKVLVFVKKQCQFIAG